ncbi:class I adenylate-forming enzyme family protein [Paraburkholderia silvatlantica]|uniref:class I adenylate-forming enzyme family protein n=1 Tax=Paraburkholderia silvatlantica TaxID=321895 RepID=UPI00105F6FF9|nr:class I adenylate-forming enzyme family protein [Paraburkholderia silvatlantica]TDR04976.1 acyl-CoA synthetase (AMP-forming)/AMP-acid ligase II [Paraburkholderia silvatlantica]
MSLPRNLGDLIGRSADPEALALIELDEALTPVPYRFGELDALAGSVAAALAGRHARGERIAVLAANSAHYVATVLGIMRAGLVAVPVNFRFPRALIADVIADSGARFVFCDAKRVADLPTGLTGVVFDARAQLPARELPDHVTPFSDFVANVRATRFEPVEPLPGEAALMLYTSGSTGRPKGVVLSHESHLWVVHTRLLSQPLADERMLIAAPLFHMNALALAFLALAAHATIVMLPQFEAANYIRAVAAWRCTWLTAVPPMIAMMLQQRELLAQSDLSSVRYVRMGSAPVSATLLEQIHALLPNARVINAYGTTEGGPVVFGPHPQGLPTPPLSVGAAHPLVKLRLVDERGVEAEEGELQLRSPALLTGYHNRPDVRAPLTEDGYYRTGDVFRRDAQGFYTFVGRRDDMFVCGGENIYPGEVERLLERHPDVAQACVVPVADEIKGAKPVAFVVLKAGAQTDEATLKHYALDHAPAFQHPRRVWFVDMLPIASTNKIDRAALKGEAARRVAATTPTHGDHSFHETP